MKRKNHQNDIAFSVVSAFLERIHVSHYVAAAEHDTFRRACRSGSIDYKGGLFLVFDVKINGLVFCSVAVNFFKNDFSYLRFAGKIYSFFDVSAHFFRKKDYIGRAVVDYIGNFFGRAHEIDRTDNAVRFPDSVKRINVFRSVLAYDENSFSVQFSENIGKKCCRFQ